MTDRGLLTRIPLWIRVLGIVVLVLAGVIIGASIFSAAGVGGHGSRPRDDATPTPHSSTSVGVSHSNSRTDGHGGAAPTDGHEASPSGSHHGLRPLPRIGYEY